MTRICLCFYVFMSRKILAKSSSNQKSCPEQRRAHDAGTSSMCNECRDVQFATICCLLMPSSSVMQLIGYSAQERDLRAEIFLQENTTLADIASAEAAALICLYTGAVGDTLYKLWLQRFHQKLATTTLTVQTENLPPTSSAAKYHSLRGYIQV